MTEEHTQISDCEVCGGDCAAANPPVMNCPLQTPCGGLTGEQALAAAKSFWCVVALNYDKDEAHILDQSIDVRDCDLLDGSSGEDNGLLQDWVKEAVPGLYKLYLRPWSHQDWQGEWDGGVDVTIVEQMVVFPPRLCDDEGCPHYGTDHVCVERAEALRLLAAEDERQSKLHELLETIREQIRTEIEPEHRPDGLFTNIQNAVYAMRGRTLLMNDAAIVGPLSSHNGTSDKPWTCAGRKQSLPEPGECDWPLCGCDPHATKVIESLLEQGWTCKS